MAHTLAALLRRLDPVTPDPAADAALVRRYAATGDRDALAALVHRHGPLVYRVCRRLLRPDDVEDGFQATFLVLARRASSVRKAESVVSWLIGVAGRVAGEVRRVERRRARHEVPLVGEVAVEPGDDQDGLERAEHARLLHEELCRLPEQLRGPLVACLLQGRTSDEAAAELGSSPRTVRRRVEQGKRVLRGRLERRGVAPAVATALVAEVGVGAVVVPVELFRRSAEVVSDFLAGVTSPPAVLAQGVAKAMCPRNVLTQFIVVAVCLGALGVGLAGGQPPGAVPPRPPVASSVPAAAPISEGQRDPVYYYPTRVGDRLTYRFPTADVTYVVTAVDKKGDTRVVSMGTVEDSGKVSPWSKVEVSAKGLLIVQAVVYHARLDGQGGQTSEAVYGDRNPPHLMLKLPATPGLKWDAPISAGLPARCVAQKEETVRVPAGEFRTIPVDLFIGVQAVAGKPFRHWYAPGVGSVKWETAGEGDVVLKSFTPGKE